MIAQRKPSGAESLRGAAHSAAKEPDLALTWEVAGGVEISEDDVVAVISHPVMRSRTPNGPSESVEGLFEPKASIDGWVPGEPAPAEGN